MKKSTYFFIAVAVVEMVITYLMRNSLSIGALTLWTTVVPMIMFPIIGGQIIYQQLGKNSFFWAFIFACVASLIILPYSLIFPWNELANQSQSAISFSPNIGSVISTVITEFILTGICMMISKAIFSRQED